MLYKRILIPTDGSDISSAAARAGVDLAGQLRAETIGIYVAPEYVYPLYGAAVPLDPETEDEYNASARSTGESYLKEIQDAAVVAGVQFTGIIVFSDSPAKHIVDTAEKNGCDLIFMGSHGRGGLGQLVLGSITSKVLSTCQIPVLVYRSRRGAAR